jgi:uncharacterized membrane protein YdjX (TVP38/TMEM64 family)
LAVCLRLPSLYLSFTRADNVALDRLSTDLAGRGFQGQLIFASLIFVTTIPPLPLYSTLIVLSGYTFGVWNGFVVSYIASLIGAVVVFVVSRGWFRNVIASRYAVFFICQTYRPVPLRDTVFEQR